MFKAKAILPNNILLPLLLFWPKVNLLLLRVYSIFCLPFSCHLMRHGVISAQEEERQKLGPCSLVVVRAAVYEKFHIQVLPPFRDLRNVTSNWIGSPRWVWPASLSLPPIPWVLSVCLPWTMLLARGWGGPKIWVWAQEDGKGSLGLLIECMPLPGYQPTLHRSLEHHSRSLKIAEFFNSYLSLSVVRGTSRCGREAD